MANKNTTHLSGEFLVAGELSRRGYPVSITMGNAKSVDIYAESSAGVLKIDAKAGRAKGNWPIANYRPYRGHRHSGQLIIGVPPDLALFPANAWHPCPVSI